LLDFVHMLDVDLYCLNETKKGTHNVVKGIKGSCIDILNI